jgi:hypothetical protein
LERLKTLDGEKHLSHQLTKPTKAAFGGFVGASGKCVSPKIGDDALPSGDQAEFEERAAICEFDGELPRSHAELLAVASVVPLAPGETPEQRDAMVIHFAEYLDRLRAPQRKSVSECRS